MEREWRREERKEEREGASNFVVLSLFIASSVDNLFKIANFVVLSMFVGPLISEHASAYVYALKMACYIAWF
jgi:hypothetical protein